jgi:hypothetical protein
MTMMRRGTIRNLSRVRNELAKIRRERACEAAAKPAPDDAALMAAMAQNHYPAEPRPAATPAEPQKAIDARLTAIARTTLGLETLETRRSDGLDFHDLAVWQIKQALQAAYEAGRASAQ